MPRIFCGTNPICRRCAQGLDVDLEAEFDEAEITCTECGHLNIVCRTVEVWYDVSDPKAKTAQPLTDWDDL